MYPVLFRIGDFEITSFGVLVAVAALVGLWLFERERRRSGLPDNAVDGAMAGVFGGLAGAKLVWAIEHMSRAEPFLDLLLSRGGLSWFGGFAGGVLAGLLVLRRRRLPILQVLAAATPALALGHAIGRVGCFLVGDDYGIPSNLPWAVAFPLGLPPTSVPVHPTQLYEMAALLAIALVLLRWRRDHRPDRFVLGTYLAATGSVRFAIEFLRMREPLFGPFAVAHVFSLAAIGVGVALLFSSRRGTMNTSSPQQGRGAMVRMSLIVMAVMATIAGGLSLVAQGKAESVTVYKDPTCGCCAKWVEHLQQQGFVATVNEVANVDDVKTKNHVPQQARSCHTALVRGYVIEGHVPAADIQRLLKERPAGVVGLAVPGMPIGSPGMEVPGMKAQPFNVVAFDKEGRTTVFAAHGR